MAIYLVPKAVQRAWDEWNLRGVVLCSFMLQILLILLAGSRKRTGKLIIMGAVWLAYIMADSIAIFGIGLIVNQLSSDCDKGSVNNKVAAFWAPFLLLHLGGPDSITAFAIEDNALWRRHLVGLIAEVSVVIYVVFLVIPNPFWIPSVLVFLAGIIKYVERTMALYYASFGSLKESIGSDEDQKFTIKRHPICQEKGSDAEEIDAINNGYVFYKVFLDLISDRGFSGRKGRVVADYFSEQKPRRVFRILEVELNFMYDDLFTKMAMVHRGCLGYFLRLTSIVSICSALLLFAIHKKPITHAFDIAVTYTLLAGAVILEFGSLIRLIFCNWTLVTIKSPKILRAMYAIQKKISFSAQYWSEAVYQHSLIDKCLKRDHNPTRWLGPVVKYLGANSTMLKDFPFIKYQSSEGELLTHMIFNHLNDIGILNEGGNFMEAFSKRDRTVNDYVDKDSYNIPFVVRSLRNVEYNESVFIWHIATNLLYHTRTGIETSDDMKSSKMLSDYLFYLLEVRPTLVPSTTEVFRNEFKKGYAALNTYLGKELVSQQSDAYKKLQDVMNTLPTSEMVFKFGSILTEALLVARQLQEMERDSSEKTWEMMKRVLLDLLCYAAVNGKTSAHLEQLTKGGDLLTLVWLLMPYFKLKHYLVDTNVPLINDGVNIS